MATDFNSVLTTQRTSENKLNVSSGKVANFAYTNQALTTDSVAGTESYNYQQENNIPVGSSEILQVADDILYKGVRSQASSLTRMMINHFFGRCSYNVNKLSEHLHSLLSTLISFFKEGDNEWSATTLYTVGDVVYFMSELNYKPCKRTFQCIVDCPDVNYPPVYSDGSLINTTYWKEVGNNVGGLEVNGSTVMNGSLTVNGDITQSGTTYVTHAEQIYTKKDNIITREDASSGLASGSYSGIKVTNYDGHGTDGILAYRSDGTAVVGDYTDGNPPTESLQPLLTRAETNQLTNGEPFVWDSVNKRAITGNIAGTYVVTASSTTISSTPLANNKPLSIMFTSNIADSNATGGVTPLVLNYNTVDIPVKASKGGALVDIYAHEIATNIWRYIDAWTTLNLVYLDDYDGGGNHAFIVVGNPVVLSSTDYTIYADGMIRYADENKLSNVESFVLSYDVNNQTLIPYDGFLFISGGSYSLLTFYINNIELGKDRKDGSIESGSMNTIPVSKGDSVYIVKGSEGYRDCKARFYKNRDYSNR